MNDPKTLISQLLAAVFAAALCLIAPAPDAYAAQAPAAAAQSRAAEEFVRTKIDRGYEILRNTKISEMQRQTTFRGFLLDMMDTRRIGLFTLGPFANRAPKTDVDAFVAAFSEFTSAIYETRLSKYKDQVLAVVGSQSRADDDFVVNCNATDPAHPSEPPFKVAFRIRKNADGMFTVTDMNIEGIWQTLSHRADFTSFLQQHGGRVSDLVNDLKRQTQMLYASG